VRLFGRLNQRNPPSIELLPKKSLEPGPRQRWPSRAIPIVIHDRFHAAPGREVRQPAAGFVEPGRYTTVSAIRDRAEAVRLCEDDPFFTAGLRESYVLKAWGFAPCYADVVL